MYGQVIYGSYMEVDGDSELVEEYEEKIPGLRSIRDESGDWKVYVGLDVLSVVPGDQGFDEMSLLQMIDPKQMRLQDDLVKKMRAKME